MSIELVLKLTDTILENEILKSRAGIPPQTKIFAQDIKGNFLLVISNSESTILEIIFLEFGPAIAI